MSSFPPSLTLPDKNNSTTGGTLEAAAGEPKRKRGRPKKLKGMPRRPLSAYNLCKWPVVVPYVVWYYILGCHRSSCVMVPYPLPLSPRSLSHTHLLFCNCSHVAWK